MINVYVAGPLFTEADIAQRLLEGKRIREIVGDRGEVMNPIESPVNFKETKPTAADIFAIDYSFIKKTTHFFFDISNLDQGVFVELGQALQRLETDAEINFYVVHSDIRIPAAGEYEGRHVPAGTNQYMIGALDYYGIKVYSSFKDAVNQFALDVH